MPDPIDELSNFEPGVPIVPVDDALAYLACSADVLTLDPMSLDAVIDSIATVGEATGTWIEPASWSPGYEQRLDQVATRRTAPARSVIVLEWTDPAFTAGHWVPDMVEAAGGRRCSAGRTATRKASSGRRSATPPPTS